MHVTLNGEAHAVPPGTSVAALLEQLGHCPDKIATAVNGQFIARALRQDCILREGDSVTCFQAIVGG